MLYFAYKYRYRSADGSCNNRQDGRLGKSDTALNRLVLPEYSDGVQAIRKDSNGRDLPSARQVSHMILIELRSIVTSYKSSTGWLLLSVETIIIFSDIELTHNEVI